VVDREVETSEGEKLANEYNVKFFETSAKTGQSVQEAFLEMTKQIKKKVGDNPIVNNPKRTLAPENLKGEREPSNVTLTSELTEKKKGNLNHKCKC